MNHPDFSAEGYRVVRELGRNREGGRVAWLATHLETEQKVVVKQFCFAQAGASWSAYREHEREIQVLQGLKHHGIPAYLGAFATNDGFCLVQEYKNAQSLAIPRSFTPEDIKQIAIKTLEILVYLQDRIPPVIHRDVKPENILVDDQLNVYLIDFGMSRIGSQEVAASSVFQGTPGFIPPEQLRKPTEASDLYGLGATLICLLTGTKSTQIQDMTDEDDPYLLHFRKFLPRLSPRFLGWLETMVKPRQKERFANAQTALEALKPLDVVRVPELKLNTSPLEFTASRIGEKLKQQIQLSNTMSETVLEGKWEVAPHPHDPPHTPDEHNWIKVSPREFKGNEISCDVSIDTSKLMADKFYERQLVLRSNADVEVHNISVQVKTALLPIERRPIPFLGLVGLLLCFVGLVCGIYVLVIFYPAIARVDVVRAIAAVVGTIMVCLFSAVAGAMFGIMGGKDGVVTGAAGGAVLGVVLGVGTYWDLIGVFLAIAAVIVIGISASIGPVVAFGGAKLALFTVGFGISLSIAVISGAIEEVYYLITEEGAELLGGIIRVIIFYPSLLLPLLSLLATLATGLPLAWMLIYPSIHRRRLVAEYRRSEEHLIKP